MAATIPIIARVIKTSARVKPQEVKLVPPPPERNIAIVCVYAHI